MKKLKRMKRIMSIICALCLSALAVVSVSAADIGYHKGDADLDGRITINDATTIQRYLAELGDSAGFWQFFTADTDNNGRVDINDVTTLQRELAQFDTIIGNIPDGNATIGQAAVTMSYERAGDGYMASGKAVYRDVFYLTMGNDEYKRSCDRFVCAAVRWSGADDNYPLGHVGVQADYLYSHPDKWLDVFGGKFLDSSRYTNTPPKGLEPGDVIIEYSAKDYRSHTFIYCGEGLIAAIFPDSSAKGYSITTASYQDYAPECRYWRLSYKYFRVFRCRKYETNPKYKYTGLRG